MRYVFDIVQEVNYYLVSHRGSLRWNMLFTSASLVICAEINLLTAIEARRYASYRVLGKVRAI
jgi:hypothetical protein